MDTADQLLERVASKSQGRLDKWLVRRDTWQEARKQNADSLQVQEASSQLIGGHGQVAQ